MDAAFASEVVVCSRVMEMEYRGFEDLSKHMRPRSGCGCRKGGGRRLDKARN